MAGWRLTTWPADRSIAHLIFTDPAIDPTHADLAHIVARAERSGATAIRTSAMFPRLAETVLAFGFAPVDRLALLEHHLHTTNPSGLDSPPAPKLTPSPPATYSQPIAGATATSTGPVNHSPSPLRLWQLRRAAHIDELAFGHAWANTPRSLLSIRSATPISRARAVRHQRRVAGFAITGFAGDTGYLQRLAVDPAQRRIGIARTLVLDAIGWVRRRPGPTADRRLLVNTGVDNAGALALYRGLNFVDTGAHLTVTELSLDR